MYRSKLLEKAKHLEGLAYATKERNRVIGSPGHNATINWIKSTIEKYPDYYTVALQPFDLSLGVSANLTLNDAPTEVFAVSLSPQGSVTGEVVVIPNLACDAVSKLICANRNTTDKAFRRIFLPTSRARLCSFSVARVNLLSR